MKLSHAIGAIVYLAATLSAHSQYFLDSRVNTNPSFQYTPSPADWRDINVYQIFTDRFYDGDPSNNNVRTMRSGTGWYGEQTNGKSWYNTGNSSNANERHLAQGGDWEGLRQKIPYLTSMGVKCVWISSVLKNEQGADKRYTPYHSYHPTDFYNCEPLFGDFNKLKQTIDELHANGIYVILDVVPNHMSDLAGLGNGQDDNYYGNGNGNLHWWDNNVQHAPPFNRLDWIHSNGKILHWDDYPETQLGAFVGTDDLATERADVQEALANAYKNLIDATDCDGFRVDAIKHVGHDWIKNWAYQMRQHAAYRGKSNFIVFGELFSYDDSFQAFFTNGNAFNSTMWFSMMGTLRNVFAESGSTSSLTGQLNNVHNNNGFGEGSSRAITFIDNHDVDRVSLNYGSSWVDMLRPAMGLLYTAAPVPTILYGTEHGFNQGGKANAGLNDGDYQRECMMNFGYQWGNAGGDKFNASSPIKDLIGQINAAREDYPCLARGNFTKRWDASGRGIYAFTRALDDQEALVVLNTDWNNAQSCAPAVGKPDGTIFTNVLNTSETATVAGGVISTSVPVRGLKIFVSGSPDNDEITISNTRQWPTNGNIDSTSDVWIDADTADKGAAVSGQVITSIDGGNTWTAHDLVRNPDFDTATTDAWHVNLGAFPADATVQYAVNFTNSTPETFWDSQGGANYSFTVNSGGGVVTLTAVENTSTNPVAGQLDEGEDLIVSTQSFAIDAGIGGGVAYNDGSGWQSASFTKGSPTVSHDTWSVNLGSFPAGTTIQFAVNVSDGTNTIWDNNSGNDFTITVNGGGLPTGDMGLALQIDGNQLKGLATNLTTAQDYALQSSMDLASWSNELTFTATAPMRTLVISDDWAALKLATPKKFYRLCTTVGAAPILTSTAVTTSNTQLNVGDNVVITGESSEIGAASEVSIVYNTDPNGAGAWPTAVLNKVSSNNGKDQWSVDLGNGFTNGQTITYAMRFARADGGPDIWENNGGANYTVAVGSSGGTGTFGPLIAYSTNPSLGHSVSNGGITIDGANNGEWTDDKLVAIDMANDDPRSLGTNWTMHEGAVDITHVWAAWDDNHLYLAWQFVDVTDKIDPANAGSSGGGKISNNDGILQWIALDTKLNQGATLDMWGKNDGQPLWTGDDKPDVQIYMAGSLWQGYVSRAVNNVFPVDDGGVNYFTCAAAGITYGKGSICAASSLWGVGDADDRFQSGSPNRSFLSEGHDTSRDSFYEIKIPLSFLQLTRSQLEASGIGVMVAGGSASLMDCAPHDEATLDSPGVESYNSSFEWGDVDALTSPFARIGNWKP